MITYLNIPADLMAQKPDDMVAAATVGIGAVEGDAYCDSIVVSREHPEVVDKVDMVNVLAQALGVAIADVLSDYPESERAARFSMMMGAVTENVSLGVFSEIGGAW